MPSCMLNELKQILIKLTVINNSFISPYEVLLCVLHMLCALSNFSILVLKYWLAEFIQMNKLILCSKTFSIYFYRKWELNRDISWDIANVADRFKHLSIILGSYIHCLIFHFYWGVFLRDNSHKFLLMIQCKVPTRNPEQLARLKWRWSVRITLYWFALTSRYKPR